LVGGVGLSLALLVAVAALTGFVAGLKPRLLARETRYFASASRSSWLRSVPSGR
jgi:hypothetical protein